METLTECMVADFMIGAIDEDDVLALVVENDLSMEEFVELYQRSAQIQESGFDEDAIILANYAAKFNLISEEEIDKAISLGLLSEDIIDSLDYDGFLDEGAKNALKKTLMAGALVAGLGVGGSKYIHNAHNAVLNHEAALTAHKVLSDKAEHIANAKYDIKNLDGSAGKSNLHNIINDHNELSKMSKDSAEKAEKAAHSWNKSLEKLDQIKKSYEDDRDVKEAELRKQLAPEKEEKMKDAMKKSGNADNFGKAWNYIKSAAKSTGEFVDDHTPDAIKSVAKSAGEYADKGITAATKAIHLDDEYKNLKKKASETIDDVKENLKNTKTAGDVEDTVNKEHEKKIKNALPTDADIHMKAKSAVTDPNNHPGETLGARIEREKDEFKKANDEHSKISNAADITKENLDKNQEHIDRFAALASQADEEKSKADRIKPTTLQHAVVKAGRYLKSKYNSLVN